MRSLIEMINKIKDRLRMAETEITYLRAELARYQTIQAQDLTMLRRSVAWYCHPDRGGDLAVMQQVNVVFDYLEKI